LHVVCPFVCNVDVPSSNRFGYFENNYMDNEYKVFAVHYICVADGGGILVLVGQDGVQRPPLHFPRGGHLLAFLSCVETGLMPLGHLEPPLWYENGTGNSY